MNLTIHCVYTLYCIPVYLSSHPLCTTKLFLDARTQNALGKLIFFPLWISFWTNNTYTIHIRSAVCCVWWIDISYTIDKVDKVVNPKINDKIIKWVYRIPIYSNYHRTIHLLCWWAYIFRTEYSEFSVNTDTNCYKLKLQCWILHFFCLYFSVCNFGVSWGLHTSIK